MEIPVDVGDQIHAKVDEWRILWIQFKFFAFYPPPPTRNNGKKAFKSFLEILTMPFSIVISFSLSTFYLSLAQVHLLSFLTSPFIVFMIQMNFLWHRSMDICFVATGSINKARVPERVQRFFLLKTPSQSLKVSFER